MFGRLLDWYIYTFPGAVAPKGIFPGAKFSLRPSLAFSYIGSFTARHSSGGRQRSFGGVGQRVRDTYTRQDGHHVGHRPTF